MSTKWQSVGEVTTATGGSIGMGKCIDPLPERRDECPKCNQVLQPLGNGIPHWCQRQRESQGETQS